MLRFGSVAVFASFFCLCYSALHEDITRGDTNAALAAIHAGSANLGRVGDKHSMTALHLASYKGNEELVIAIISKEKSYINKFVIDTNSETHLKRTPLLYALHGLHELNHQPNAANTEKAKKFFNVIHFLIKNGAKTFQRDERGRNALHLALQFGLTPLIEITANDAKSCNVACSGTANDPSQQNFKNWNVFHFAAYTRYRWKMISNLLLKEGSENFSSLSSYFASVWSPIYSTLNKEDLREHVVKRTATWDIVASHTNELVEKLVSSCSEYSPDYSSMLLSFNDQKMTPYHMAADSGDSVMLEYLILSFPEAWNEANGIDVPLSTLMHVSSLRGHKKNVNVLTNHLNTCFYDQYNRIPSQVWHMKDKIPDSLEVWEQKFCTEMKRMEDFNQKRDKERKHFFDKTKCTIDVVDAAHLTPQEFEEKYLSVRKPVLVRGAVSSWPALKRWSTSYFVGMFGNLNVWMGEIPYAPQFNLPGKKGPLSHYGRYVTMIENNQVPPQMKDKPIMYVFDNEILTSPAGKGLLDDITIPSLVAEYPWSVAQFMWGPPGSGAPLHHHQDAWNGLVFGEKQWWFYPTADMSSSTKISSDWDSPYFCTQLPGDFVYVPDSWSHAVYNTKFTSAVAIEFTWAK